jgi:hypothetical protein
MKLPKQESFEGSILAQENRSPVYIDSGEGRLTRFNYIRSLWSWPYHLVYVPSQEYQKMMQHTLFELYNVEHDPYETRNLVNRQPEKTEELKKQLLRWVKNTGNVPPASQKTPDYDPEAIKQMKALGYIQ